jgi:hypothetical protein
MIKATASGVLTKMFGRLLLSLPLVCEWAGAAVVIEVSRTKNIALTTKSDNIALDVKYRYIFLSSILFLRLVRVAFTIIILFSVTFFC